MRGCLLLFVGIVLGALGLLFAQVTFDPPPPAQSDPPAVAATGPGDLTVLFRNEYLTRSLQTAATQLPSPVPLEHLTVTTAGADLVLQGAVVAHTVLGSFTVPVRAVLLPQARNNQVVIQIVAVQAGILNLPVSAFQGFDAPINRSLAQLIGNSPYRVVGVSTSPQGLVVDVTVKP